MQYEYEHNGINSITSAKILICTEEQRKINERLKLVWHNGECWVWVHEVGNCGCRHRINDVNNEALNENTSSGDVEETRTACNEKAELGELGEQPVVEQVVRMEDPINSHELVCGETAVQDTAGICAEVVGVCAAQEHMYVEDEVGFRTSCLNSRPSNSDCERVDNFDPMLEIECRVVPSLQCGSVQYSTRKKVKGRPRKVTCSLPIPLFVPSTQSSSVREAEETWRAAKSSGINARNEGEVIAELRKSKRIMGLEAENPIGN